MNHQVFWQAHRGGGANDAPDNTMSANRYAWRLGGIPEADIRTTKDGVIICLHDESPARTTTAPDNCKHLPISDFTYAEILQWDAGVKFDECYRGERVPALADVFEDLATRPENSVYLDLKSVNLEQLRQMIDHYRVNSQVIFAHHDQDNCRLMKSIAAGVKTMLWIGGDPARIKHTYQTARNSGFDVLDQVQIHLKPIAQSTDWSYEIDQEFLYRALSEADEYGIDLEVFPFSFHQQSIHLLLDMGIRWYATDEPARFLECVNPWLDANRS